MSPNNELIRDSEYGIVDEITCLDSWPELEFWNSQPWTFRISHFAKLDISHFAFRVSRNRTFRISRLA
eukprot:COSAG06_NODE_20912_length_776_cov_3.113737_2_plen_67_part_01